MTKKFDDVVSKLVSTSTKRHYWLLHKFNIVTTARTICLRVCTSTKWHYWLLHKSDIVTSAQTICLRVCVNASEFPSMHLQLSDNTRLIIILILS